MMVWKENLSVGAGIALVIGMLFLGVMGVFHLYNRSYQQYIDAGYVLVNQPGCYKEVWVTP